MMQKIVLVCMRILRYYLHNRFKKKKATVEKSENGKKVRN